MGCAMGPRAERLCRSGKGVPVHAGTPTQDRGGGAGSPGTGTQAHPGCSLLASTPGTAASGTRQAPPTAGCACAAVGLPVPGSQTLLRGPHPPKPSPRSSRAPRPAPFPSAPWDRGGLVTSLASGQGEDLQQAQDSLPPPRAPWSSASSAAGPRRRRGAHDQSRVRCLKPENRGVRKYHGPLDPGPLPSLRAVGWGEQGLGAQPREARTLVLVPIEALGLRASWRGGRRGSGRRGPRPTNTALSPWGRRPPPALPAFPAAPPAQACRQGRVATRPWLGLETGDRRCLEPASSLRSSLSGGRVRGP